MVDNWDVQANDIETFGVVIFIMIAINLTFSWKEKAVVPGSWVIPGLFWYNPLISDAYSCLIPINNSILKLSPAWQ